VNGAYSPGWGRAVVLGEGQQAVLDQLRASVRHPSRTWHDAPTMRAFGRSPGTAHRLVHRLQALGVVAIQPTLGRLGGVRFTFGVRRWRYGPHQAGQLRRMLGRRPLPPPPGQLELFAEPGANAPPARAAETFSDRLARLGFQPWWLE
jgi:hypothetical protein